MNIAEHAAATPDKVAIVMAGSGAVTTYQQLDDRSRRVAQVLQAAGLRIGDHVAVYMENHPRYLEVALGALRSGLYVTPINCDLGSDDVAYILNDCEARALFTSTARADVAGLLLPLIPHVTLRLVVDGHLGGFDDLAEIVPSSRIPAPAHEPLGEYMMYSSGTTGRPKGIIRALSGRPFSAGTHSSQSMAALFGFGTETVYLSPAPLYSAPIALTTSVLTQGGTIVVMERFDPAVALDAIERYRVTHAMFVPTMFIQMLRLPEPVRAAVDVSSLRLAAHAAAPCPVAVKHRMIEWWGPVLEEFYAGTESVGMTYISSAAWLEHPGSVGRITSGRLHIVDRDGVELRPNQVGTVYFDAGASFEYHHDPIRTAAAHHPEGWATLGDLGYLDDDGFLYLVDRQAFVIVSGGLTIYPREIEDSLALHPKVADVAVVGVPDSVLGEAVKAIVQPLEGVQGDAELAAELMAYLRDHLSADKCPRSIDFDPELPRLATGKLYKAKLRARYWPTTPTTSSDGKLSDPPSRPGGR